MRLTQVVIHPNTEDKDRGARCSYVVRVFAHGAMGRRIDPLSYLSFQPVLHDWCNKGRGMKATNCFTETVKYQQNILTCQC